MQLIFHSYSTLVLFVVSILICLILWQTALRTVNEYIVALLQRLNEL